MTHQDNVPLAKMSAAQMEKHLFNLKFASKQLMRDSKKADKEEKAEKKKLQKAIEKGNMDVARIHAENAIRQKNQSLNYLRMSARIDAVASRVQTAVTTKRVTSSMQGVVKAMDSAMKSMNLEKVRRREFQLIFSLSSLGLSYHACAYFQISGLMDKFEKEFEDLDVQTSVMENTMGERNVFGPSVCSVSDIPTFFREYDGDERAAGRCRGADEAGGRRGGAGAEHGTPRRREQHDRHDGGQQRPGRVEPEAGQTQAVDLVGREFVIGWERVEFGKFGQSDWYLIYKAYVRVACKFPNPST